MASGSFGLGGGLPVKFTGTYSVNPDGMTGSMTVHAELTDGHYIYSVTQPKGGPLATKFKIKNSPSVELTGDWAASKAPKPRRTNRALKEFWSKSITIR